MSETKLASPQQTEKQRKLKELRDLLNERRRRRVERPLDFYRSLPHQARFHSSQARERVFIAGNRTGKSEANVVECVRRAKGEDPHRQDIPVPNIGWVISVSNESQREILQPKFEKYLAKGDIERIRRRPNGVWDQIILKNGSVIGFKSCEMERKVFQGAALHWASFDEEPEKDIYDEVKLRLADYQGDLWITLTPVNGMSWTFDQWVDEETRIKSSEVFTASMWDNARSRGGYIEDVEIQKQEDEISDPVMKRIRIYGEYHSQVGRIYKTFDKKVHGLGELPMNFLNQDNTINQNYEIYVGLDTGRKFAAVWVLVDYFANAFLFDEYLGEDKPIPRHAQAIKNTNNIWGISPTYIIDPTSQFVADLAEYGINGLGADNEVQKGIEAVMQYMAYRPQDKIGPKYNNPKLFVVLHRMKQWLREVQRYQWEAPAKSGASVGEAKNKPRKKDDHLMDACLVAGTLVETIDGQRPIESVNVGDLVLTQNGYRPVSFSGMTNPDAKTFEITTENGAKLRGTLDHPVYVVGRGWTRLDRVRVSDMLLSCRASSNSSTEGATTCARPVDTTSTQEASRFIAPSGNQKMGRYRKASTFTTRTEILSTIGSRISKSSLARSTSPITEKSGPQALGFLNAQDATLSSRQECSGLVNGSAPTNANPPIVARQGGTISRRDAWPAGKSTLGTDTPELKPVPVSVVNVSASTQAPVFDITVDEAHHFFANGILVHNTRYVLIGRPERSRVSEGEEDPRPMMDQITERVKEKLKKGNQDRQGGDPWGLSD